MRQLLVVTLLCSYAFAQSPKQHADDKHAAQSQTSKSSDNQSIPDTIKPPETQFYTYNNQNPERNETAKEISDYLLALFTLTLAVVSVLQWRVLGKHEKWMREHDTRLRELAVAAKDNALAAKDNAKALISSERAWITVYVKWGSNSGRRTLPDGRSELPILCILANRGRSPAWIIERYIKAEVSIGFYGPDYSNVPDSEIDRKFIPLSPRDNPNSDTIDFQRRLATKEVTQTNKFILIYGYVKYRDIFTQQGNPRETQFGFFMQPGQVDEPIDRITQPEYNRYT